MNIPASDPQVITQKRAKLQLMSLVAILFLLFAAFAMSTLPTLNKKAVSVDLAYGGWGCSCGASSRGEPPVVLQVTDTGIFWNKALITEREFPAILAKYAANCKSPRIVLASDETAKLGTTIWTLDEIRKAGIKQVNVETVYRGTGK